MSRKRKSKQPPRPAFSLEPPPPLRSWLEAPDKPFAPGPGRLSLPATVRALEEIVAEMGLAAPVLRHVLVVVERRDDDILWAPPPVDLALVRLGRCSTMAESCRPPCKHHFYGDDRGDIFLDLATEAGNLLWPWAHELGLPWIDGTGADAPGPGLYFLRAVHRLAGRIELNLRLSSAVRRLPPVDAFFAPPGEPPGDLPGRSMSVLSGDVRAAGVRALRYWVEKLGTITENDGSVSVKTTTTPDPGPELTGAAGASDWRPSPGCDSEQSFADWLDLNDRKIPAKLVEFMKGRTTATHEDVWVRVHGESREAMDSAASTMRANARRTNEIAQAQAYPNRYRVTGSKVHKRDA